jgi:hypothetical protein
VRPGREPATQASRAAAVVRATTALSVELGSRVESGFLPRYLEIHGLRRPPNLMMYDPSELGCPRDLVKHQIHGST